MSTDIQIQHAIAETILTTGLTPSTPLTAPSLVGDTSVFIAPGDTSDYRPGGVLCVWDGTSETIQAIKAVNQSTGEIQLNFAGRTPGLQFAHSVGATVGTGLLTEAPVVIGPMIAAGPVIFVYVSRMQSGIQATRKTSGPVTVRIQHHTALLQDEDDPQDPNLWAIDQQRTARTNLATIQDALLANWHLNASNGANAQGLGDGTRPVFSTAFEHMAVDMDNMQFVAVLEVVVRPGPQTFTP
jgi:hypothetical protein